MTDMQWDLQNPFTCPLVVKESDTDRLGHTNNVTYLGWLEAISWEHIEPLGMGWDVQQSVNRAMAIMRTEIDYLAASYSGEKLMLATWITQSDGRLYSSRQFQLIRPDDGKTIIRAKSNYACIDIKSGRPSRMPEAFVIAHQRAMDAHGF